jgi:hypothetical protein
MNTTPTIVLSSLFFLVAGEFFYVILTQKKRLPLAKIFLRLTLVVVPPLLLIGLCLRARALDSLMLVTLGVIALAFLIVPRRAIRRLVEMRYESLKSDIPFFDPDEHPIRSVLIVVGAYWIIWTFFARELVRLAL